jgi:hypothetical protein
VNALFVVYVATVLWTINSSRSAFHDDASLPYLVALVILVARHFGMPIG